MLSLLVGIRTFKSFMIGSAWVLLVLSNVGDCLQVYNVGVLMASRLHSPFDLERCAPAVDLALSHVNQHLLKHHDVHLHKVQASYSSCSGEVAPGLAADMYFIDKVIAFIGPACAFALEPVARLAAYWNVPIITGMGDQPPSEGQLTINSGLLNRLQRWKNESAGIFKDKSHFKTLTRMSYCQCRLTLVFRRIFFEFSWTHVALILDKSDLFSFTVGKNLEMGLKKAGVLSFMRELDGNDEEDLVGYLRDASMYARVIILSVRGFLVRKFMITAYHLGMTNGEWTFFDVEIVQGSYWGDHDWEAKDEDDKIARRAYEALLRVSLLEPTNPEFQNFSEKIKAKAQADYHYTFKPGEEVNFFVGAFYDGVYLLGMALNETLTAKGSIKDGVGITKKMWSRNFTGITGYVRIDNNGERDADYSVLDLDPITGKFEVVAHYYGYKGGSYNPVEGKKIHWPGGRDSPPPDMPLCGFMGNNPNCADSSPTVTYGLIFFFVFAAVAIAMAIYLKQIRLAADLNNMSWRVRMEEIVFERGKPFSSRLALQKSTEAYEHTDKCGSTNSISSFATSPAFTIGMYKGTRVAIKKVVKKKVDINKKLLWEIKEVRNVTHENTVRFIGSCISCPTVLILTEYCPRGSLKDVLENEAIHLDWNFRMSLIHDIVKGMAFLHSSEVSVHGKLRSCNCLIDGRFVLKISDFGIRMLAKPSEIIKDEQYYIKRLWIAPELLPVTDFPGDIATQKGDVFSFSIILEEIILRGGPYQVARATYSIQEILFFIENKCQPPFRPNVCGSDCSEDLQELMERCWSESPEDRPSFESIRTVIQRMLKGYCENLMDDLLRRMEQYANNLEALVEEKTEQLSLEKRRSEELLFQVLPRPIAQQLMTGEMVQPEQFECVTIYFSDIVGFTSLCAQSTPMEVVALLNDLYSTFDRIIGYYDVYKVETIGDAYMVVSGLPERNETHAKEISLMALSILDAVQAFTICHRPDAQLKIRIGIHSGPVCAGVVGKKMPHYCLFGDTVNTASRMESTGLPLRIHVSQTTYTLLQETGNFILELRGEVELKGKGVAVTYWLKGCVRGIPRLTKWQETVARNPYPIIFPELNNVVSKL